MTEKIANDGPFRINIEFCFTDGEQVAKAGVDCPPGEVPTEENIAELAANVLKQVQSQLGSQFVWQTRHDFVGDLLSEQVGSRTIRFAVPGTDEWAMEVFQQ